jgi:hypothetical protein
MINCIDCKFWNRTGDGLEYYEANDADSVDYDEPKRSAHRTCLRILHFRDYPMHSIGEPTETACVTDGSGYAAALRTLPEFGCVLGEKP